MFVYKQPLIFLTSIDCCEPSSEHCNVGVMVFRYSTVTAEMKKKEMNSSFGYCITIVGRTYTLRIRQINKGFVYCSACQSSLPTARIHTNTCVNWGMQLKPLSAPTHTILSLYFHGPGANRAGKACRIILPSETRKEGVGGVCNTDVDKGEIVCSTSSTLPCSKLEAL